MPKKILTLLFVIYVGISHLILPIFNNSKDFFFFSTWQLFAEAPAHEIADLSWNKDQERLFRDHLKQAKAMGIPVKTIAQLLGKHDVETVRQKYKAQLLAYCRCDSITLSRQKNNNYNYLINGESGAVISSEKL